jgi:hypothetical protein
LAASVMHRLDSKRRRFDARRIHGEGEDWQDWQEILKSSILYAVTLYILNILGH